MVQRLEGGRRTKMSSFDAVTASSLTSLLTATPAHDAAQLACATLWQQNPASFTSVHDAYAPLVVVATASSETSAKTSFGAPSVSSLTGFASTRGAHATTASSATRMAALQIILCTLAA